MLHDFFKNKIISQDMADIFSVKGINSLKGKSFYISGASGMLASYLTMFLIYLNEEHDYRLKIYAGIRKRQKAYSRFGCYADKKYFHIIESDVVRPLPVNEPIDYLIHAASPASPQYYGGNPVETMLPNIVGTYQISEHAKKYGAESVLFFSSGAVYGKSSDKRIFEHDSGVFDFLAPCSVYGESKRCGEALGNAYFREYGMPFKSVRIHHVYGPTLDLANDHRAFAEFTKSIVEGKDIILTSDGSQKRAFCYITDALRAIIAVLLRGQNGESYNLANASQFVSISELANVLTSLYPDKGLKVIHKSRNEEGYLPLAQTSSVECDTSKIRSLGCEFKVSVEEGFKRTIEYFIESSKVSF